MKRSLPVFLLLVSFFLTGAPLHAEMFQCEVLSVKGSVKVTDSQGHSRDLKQGDLLQAGDEIESGELSYADLAYDRDWQNITRIESNSKVKTASVVPSKLDLKEGGVFSKLKKVPRDSTFEVKTPTAVASVRGTEYRTVVEDGDTEVFNASSSEVTVYGLKDDGSVDTDSAVLLEKDKKTRIADAGESPAAPADMSSEEKSAGIVLKRGIEANVEEAKGEGREANIQTIEQIETHVRKERTESQNLYGSNESDLSRVTDTRRRAFGGGDKALAPPQEALVEEAREEIADALEPEPPSADNA